MVCRLEGDSAALASSGLVLGLASLVAMASGALALWAGAPVQTLQKVMTWMSIPWFGGCCLVCRWGYGQRRRKAAIFLTGQLERPRIK